MGQNFLRDKNVLKKIIGAANLTKDETVLEVGPGEGVLTAELAQATGHVIAVEKDPELAAQLKIKFTNSKNVEIIEDDILEFVNRKSLFINHPYKVVANIPYYLTSHLIRLLLESVNPPQDMVLMVQKEVAQRLCASPPKMSLLAAATQFYADVKIIAKVSKNSFWPKPKVDSAILRLTPHGKYRHIDISKFFPVLHAGFSHPRKQLLNNLNAELKISRDKINEALLTADLKPNQRAETLRVENWIKLASLLLN